MGIALVRYSRPVNYNASAEGLYTKDHEELFNRDSWNQHPIFAIIGLPEYLNMLEDSIDNTNEHINTEVKRLDKRIDDLQLEVDQLSIQVAQVAKDIATIRNVNFTDTNSIKWEHNDATNNHKAHVKIWHHINPDKDHNALQELGTGLYVPKFITKDSTTIKWASESLGETLSDIFTSGGRFSHNTNSWSEAYSPGEMNAWYWDDNLQSFVQPQNTSYFNGFITSEMYDMYIHTARIVSTNSDDDWNGIIIGYIVDDDGHPHTLSALIDRGGAWTGAAKNALAIWYDFYLPDAQLIMYRTIPGGSGGWSSVAANGITLQVKKHRSNVSVVCSSWNQCDLNDTMRMEFNLDNYEWGHYFNDVVKYGYCSLSQASSYFQDVEFISSYTADAEETTASVLVSDDNNNGIEVHLNGLWQEKFIVSQDAENALIKKANGYYVLNKVPSKRERNALQELDDGFYIKDMANFKQVTQTAHGFKIGDFIYYHPSGKYMKASALDDYCANIVGMVTEIMDANTFEFQWDGFFKTNLFNTNQGFTQGMPLYISADTPGTVIQEQPDISKTVGYPIENSGILISIERGIQYNQEPDIGDFKTSANDYNIRSDGFIRIVEGVNYKNSLVEPLLNVLSYEFKQSYIIQESNQTIQFKNVSELYEYNNIRNGLNLFIKAF